ncbi:MAG TPA: hypothetical protein VMW38_12070 [Terriglobia bacterium]|nr:hypothetical protein [Terriglobia bacterium]
MIKGALVGIMFLVLCTTAFAVTAVEGKIEKIDHKAKIIVVKTVDGAEHTFHVSTRTIVHGTEKAGAATQDAFRGLKEGSAVVVHYSGRGTEETAEEVDHVGEDGLKTAEGIVTQLDRGAKTLAVKTADGSNETFRIADHAAEDGGKDITEGAEKSAKVTVYYSEQAGQKVAHFFKKAL